MSDDLLHCAALAAFIQWAKPLGIDLETDYGGADDFARPRTADLWRQFKADWEVRAIRKGVSDLMA